MKDEAVTVLEQKRNEKLKYPKFESSDATNNTIGVERIKNYKSRRSKIPDKKDLHIL